MKTQDHKGPSAVTVVMANIRTALASDMPQPSKSKLETLQYKIAQQIIANEIPKYLQ